MRTYEVSTFHKIFGSQLSCLRIIHHLHAATSMSVTDVEDEMCWRQLWSVGDDFRRFCHQHPLSLNINVGHQQSKYVTNIEILSVTSKFCHQDSPICHQESPNHHLQRVTNIDIACACDLAVSESPLLYSWTVFFNCLSLF